MNDVRLANAARHQQTGAVSYADFADWRRGTAAL
jgi:hypothetical protein